MDTLTTFSLDQVLHPLGATGAVDVTVTLSGYRSAILDAHQISAESPPFWITNDRGDVVQPDITATLSILLVSDTLVTPNRTTLFNHPSSRLLLQVTYFFGILSSACQCRRLPCFAILFLRGPMTLKYHR